MSNNKIHIIGINGIGLSAIAALLQNQGYYVQGSDLIEKTTLKDVTIYNSHKPENVHNANIILRSSAISDDHIEVCEARKLNKPVLNRADLLPKILAKYYVVAISGSHGKTTTTMITEHVLSSVEQVNCVCGGIMKRHGSNIVLYDKSRVMVFESDESDGTVFSITPDVAVLTNVAKEHMPYFGTMENSISKFTGYLNKAKHKIVCLDSDYVDSILLGVSKENLFTYSLKDESAFGFGCNIREYPEYTIFDLILDSKKRIKNIKIPLIGKFNVLNSIASILTAVAMRVAPLSTVVRKLPDMKGVRRRQDVLFKDDNLLIMDDYAHHPDEMRCILETLKESERKVLAVIEPHRMSRVKDSFDEYLEVLSIPDVVLLCDVYAAGETENQEYNSMKLYQVMDSPNIHLVSTKEQILDEIEKKFQDLYYVVFLGAGKSSEYAHYVSRAYETKKESI